MDPSRFGDAGDPDLACALIALENFRLNCVSPHDCIRVSLLLEELRVKSNKPFLQTVKSWENAHLLLEALEYHSLNSDPDEALQAFHLKGRIANAKDDVAVATTLRSVEPKLAAAESAHSSLSTGDGRPNIPDSLFNEGDFILGAPSQQPISRAIVLGPRGSGKSRLREALAKANSLVRPFKRFTFTAFARTTLKDFDPSWLDQRFVFNSLVEEERNDLEHLLSFGAADSCLLLEGSSLGFLDSAKIPSAFFWECSSLSSFALAFAFPSVDAVFVSTRYDEETLALALSGLPFQTREKLLPHLTQKFGWVVYWPHQCRVQRVVVPKPKFTMRREDAYDPGFPTPTELKAIKCLC